ncbi:hypothetical protein ADK61_34540 [Streptomyces sp. XY66]|nr:hypothetical protein ADK61_34540 [Streptomyces sp. XY66]
MLVMVLAGLLHVLGCAHGPQAAGAPRTDTLAVVTAPAHGHPAAPVADVLCDHGAGAGCTGVDEPAVVGSRADLPTFVACRALVAPDCTTGQLHRAREHRARSPGGTRADHGRQRAALGIWRA